MTKLEEEIFKTIDLSEMREKGGIEAIHLIGKQSQAAAEVAKRYIEKAFKYGAHEQHLEAWLKENGVTE